MTNKEKLITGIAGLAISAIGLTPAPLPSVDDYCVGVLEGSISNGMNYSEDPYWQYKTREVNKCFDKFYQQTINPKKGDMVVVNLQEDFQNELRKGLSGGQADRAVVTERIIKYHLQAAHNIKAERPTIISKVFGKKNKIVLDDADETLESVKNTINK